MGKQRLIKIGSIVFVVLLVIFFAIRFLMTKGEPITPITLNFWGAFDDSDIYTGLITDFQKSHPQIQVVYKKFSYEDYERELLDSLNKNKGPDIFMIHNSFLWRYKKFLYPLPENIISLNNIKNNYSPVIFKDFYDGSALYSLPLYVSTLALFYNQDLFDRKTIDSPPKTWDDFLKDTSISKKIDENGNILMAGSAMGTSKNINRAVDILYLLMLQSGTRFYNNQGYASFANDLINGSQTVNPAERALKFYTDFANPKKNVYTYNNNLDYSIDSFSKGNSAMMINYNWQIETIKRKNSSLNFRVASIPQIKDTKNPLTFSNYWSLAVNKASKYRDSSWEFIKFLEEPGNLKIYLQKTKNPTPRKDLISWQIQNMPELGIFASQILIAESLARYDDVAYEKIFSKIIDNVVYDYYSAKSSLENGQDEINKIIGR